MACEAFGVQKLLAIKRCYDRNQLAEGTIHRNAFKLLLKQTNSHLQDNAKDGEIFGDGSYQIPLFPYRMQMVTLWQKPRIGEFCKPLLMLITIIHLEIVMIFYLGASV